MFHKIKNVAAIPDFKLSVQFSEGVTKVYDMKLLFEKLPAFKQLENDPAEFACVSVDVGGYPHARARPRLSGASEACGFRRKRFTAARFCDILNKNKRHTTTNERGVRKWSYWT